eukprot:TRINITY_DN7055_c0_g1_i2.p1 TRINITY_DN7055_c0_g1~~TRINITY_DN7055_c0_g1_i2.p1  ORF type:complete len:202 (+),score=28.43 TRINITY_DN7055_c0_g1_i2:143-748(+)
MEFSNFGEHCADPLCKQKAFLPFKCNYCKKEFCFDHKDAEVHKCEHAQKGNVIALICPICKIVIKTDEPGKADELMNIHLETACNASQGNVKPTENHKKCSVSGCKTKLYSVNTYICKKCDQILCLAHRYEDDHNCRRRLGGGSSRVNLEEKVAQISNQESNQRRQQQQTNTAEYCYVCGMGFFKLEDLISHAERSHFSMA